MMNIIIGLVGERRSGKTTVADHLVSQHGFRCYSFADPLKVIAGRTFNLSPSQLYGTLKDTVDPRYGVSPRQLFQCLGDAVRDVFDDMVLVRHLFKQIHKRGPGRYVIDDVRYLMEAAWIREAGEAAGTRTVLLRLQYEDSSVNDEPSEIDAHASEQEMQGIPFGWFRGAIKWNEAGGVKMLLRDVDALLMTLRLGTNAGEPS